MNPWPADGFRKPLTSPANQLIWLRLCALSSTSLPATIFTLAGGSVEDDKTRRFSFFSTHSEGEGRMPPNRLMLSVAQRSDTFYFRLQDNSVQTTNLCRSPSVDFSKGGARAAAC